MGYSDNFAIKLNIDLEKGIYVFQPKSSSGKTRLFYELCKRNMVYNNVYAYTLNDKKKGISPLDYLENPECKVVLFDRYDMYNGDFSENIIKASRDKIILIDCKTELNIRCRTLPCRIINNNDSIEVTYIC